MIGVVLGSLAILSVWSGIKRNEKLMSGKYDTVLSKELHQTAYPTLEAILAYQRDHSEYPNDIESLITNQETKYPSSYMGGYLVYIPEPFYGVPFYFGFRGNYSGVYFLHGWIIAYCPSSICTIPLSGTRRIDDTWVFIHSSAL